MASSTSKRIGSADKLSPIPHTRIEDEKYMTALYSVGKRLGEGSFGLVKLVTHLETGTIWACKAVNKERAGSTAIKLLEREVAILKRVDHEHIIKLKEVFETSKKMYLVMECCEGGELKDILKQRGSLSESEVKIIMRRLASAISYLHKHDMVHRDLKLENILLGTNPHDSSDKLYIKVTDFGLSVVKGGVGHEHMLQDFCGTPMYMAPEIIENKTYGYLCDVWAMGVITYMLLSGSPPFASRDEAKLYDIIRTADIKEQLRSEATFKDISDEAKNCIEGMLTVDPAHRITASEVLDHHWLTGREPTSEPVNVLQMMREFRDEEKRKENGSDIDVNKSNDVLASNGSLSMSENDSSNSCRDGSANSKSSSAGQRGITPTNNNNSKFTKRKTETGPTSTLRVPGSTNRPGASPAATKSLSKAAKSPSDRPSQATSHSTTSRGSSYHAARPAATKTSQASNAPVHGVRSVQLTSNGVTPNKGGASAANSTTDSTRKKKTSR